MGLADILFGRKKLRAPALDALFRLAGVQVTMESRHGLVSAGVAGVVAKPLSAPEYERVAGEVDELLDALAETSGSSIERSTDAFGYRWLVVRDPQIEDLVGAVHVVASELTQQGFGEQLLAAAFPFVPRGGPGGTGTGRPAQLIYGFKRGTFWPFVPTGEGQKRDNAYELRLKSDLEGELPIEPDLTRWLGLFDAPLGRDAPLG